MSQRTIQAESTKYLHDNNTWLYKFMYAFFFVFVKNDDYTYDIKPTKKVNILPITSYSYDTFRVLNTDYDYFCGNMNKLALQNGYFSVSAASSGVFWKHTATEFETGLDYFGARYYNSDLSVWLSVDPLADKYPSTSPFMYVRGNPVMLVDPKGMYMTRGGPEGTDPSLKDSKTGETASYYGNGKVLTYPSEQTETTKINTSTNSNSPTITTYKTKYGKVNVIESPPVIEKGYYDNPNSVDLVGVKYNYQFISNDNTTLSQESSSYRWVQTIYSNCDVGTDGEENRGKPIGTWGEFVDITDRHKPSQILYSQNVMTLEDMYYRIRDTRYPNGQYMHATITLLRVMNDGSIEPIISFHTGLYLDRGGSGGAYKSTQVYNVSPFHMKVLINNLTGHEYKH